MFRSKLVSDFTRVGHMLNDTMCETCGERFGAHIGWACEGETTPFRDKTYGEMVSMATTTGMTATPYISTTKEDKVEDLVKKALKEALEKRKDSEGVVIGEKEEKKAPLEKAKVVVAKMKVGEKQKAFSDIIPDWKGKDFAVSMFTHEDWNEAVRAFIPEVNPDYVLVPEQAEAILRAWELNEKILIYGPTGAGKSSIVEQLCAITCRPFIRTNCTGDMDSSMIFGQLTAKDGSTHWVDGTVTEAVRNGAIWCWDEWDVTPPEISMGLQWLLEDEGKLFLKEMPGTSADKFIQPHEHFRLVAVGNTQGQGDETGNHAGTNVQNTATLDRFGTCIRVGYLPESVEIDMLMKRWGSVINNPVADKLVKLANLIRQGYTSNQLSLTMSPRALLSICRKMSHGLSARQAFALVYSNKLGETHKKVVEEIFRKIYGSKDA